MTTSPDSGQKPTAHERQEHTVHALTDSEWMSLIRSGDDSELPVCCANISALRDAIIGLASDRSDIFGFGRTGMLRAYNAARAGHDLERIAPLEKLMQYIDATAGDSIDSLSRADLPDRHEPEVIEFREGLTREELLIAKNLVARLEAIIEHQQTRGLPSARI